MEQTSGMREPLPQPSAILEALEEEEEALKDEEEEEEDLEEEEEEEEEEEDLEVGLATPGMVEMMGTTPEGAEGGKDFRKEDLVRDGCLNVRLVPTVTHSFHAGGGDGEGDSGEEGGGRRGFGEGRGGFGRGRGGRFGGGGTCAAVVYNSCSVSLPSR